jgi:hypothetical protein
MSSESVCQVALSWVDVGSFHTRLVVRCMIFTASVRNILDTPSYMHRCNVQYCSGCKQLVKSYCNFSIVFVLLHNVYFSLKLKSLWQSITNNPYSWHFFLLFLNCYIPYTYWIRHILKAFRFGQNTFKFLWNSECSRNIGLYDTVLYYCLVGLDRQTDR